MANSPVHHDMKVNSDDIDGNDENGDDDGDDAGDDDVEDNDTGFD